MESIKPFEEWQYYYGYKGTAHAWEHNFGDFSRELEECGLKTENERLVGFSLCLDDNIRNPSAPLNPSVHVFLQDAETLGRDLDPVPLKKIPIEFTVERFLRIFRRFEVHISFDGELDGRKYIQTNQDEK